MSRTIVHENIKYAEVTVIKNSSNRNIMTSFGTFTGLMDEENVIDKELDQVIMTFEDDKILFDTKDRYVYCNYKFHSILPGSPDFNSIKLPNNGGILFKAAPKKVKEELVLPFNEFFKNDTTKKYIKIIPSNISLILYTNTWVEKELVELKVFCIVRMESSNSKPRYLVAYDEKNFTKEVVVYLVRQIILKLYEDC